MGVPSELMFIGLDGMFLILSGVFHFFRRSCCYIDLQMVGWDHIASQQDLIHCTSSITTI